MPYGSGPFGVSPFGGEPVVFEDQTAAELHSSDSIDFRTRRYKLDADTGERLGMDDTAQRVMLLVAFAVNELPPLIDDSTDLVLQRKIRDALKSETEAKPPTIRVTRISAGRTRAGHHELVVDYVNLRSKTKQTARARLSG